MQSLKDTLRKMKDTDVAFYAFWVSQDKREDVKKYVASVFEELAEENMHRFGRYYFYTKAKELAEKTE